MAPGCRYCRMRDDNLLHTWCSGNCEFNKIEGTCTEIKGISNINLDLIVLNHKYDPTQSMPNSTLSLSNFR